jgi:hypothetical protein
VPVKTVKKAKGTRTCGDCGANLAAGVSKCPNCNSSNIKKTLIVVKKSESVSDTPGVEAEDPKGFIEGEGAEEEVEDDDSEEEPPDEDEDDSEEDEEDEEDDDDEDEEEDGVTKRVAKSVQPSANNEAAMLTLSMVQGIFKAIGSSDPMGNIDAELTAFNNAMDEAATNWIDGKVVSKALSPERRKQLEAKLAMLKSKLADLEGGGSDDDDEEDGAMSKRATTKKTDIFKGLTPEAAEIVRKSQELIEKNTEGEFHNLAKSYGMGDEVELGKALRHLSETNESAFNAVTKTLRSAQEVAKQGAVFTSFGSPAPGSTDAAGRAQSIAKAFREKDNGLTPEQALAKAYEENPALYDEHMSGN